MVADRALGDEQLIASFAEAQQAANCGKCPQRW
jgi:hypothetical protein